ncbi:MAG: M28 family peptidase [Gammaproteobacteria bacterium]|nr:M28 family peptidase [Gammaproteobacteria bacterium]
MGRLTVLGCVFIMLAACGEQKPPAATSGPAGEGDSRRARIEAELHQHIAVLASDEFEGRAPATPGEEKTVAYLQREFAALGLQPGNGDSWFQEVPVTSVTVDPSVTLQLRGDDYSRDLVFATEMAVSTPQQLESVTVENSDMVFVGYGIVAPERGWNDYAGINVTDKTVVMLVNDPGYTSQDPALFNGNTMTYYGRWSYKYEEAARQGAAAALIVHETGAAGYPWEVVSVGRKGPQIGLTAADKNIDRVEVEGWLPLPVAEQVFAAAGLDYQTLKAAATRPGFKAVVMGGLALSATLSNSVSHALSHNVVARIPGTRYPDELIVHSAHWDHLGIKPGLEDDGEGDAIYNGASDNASGTAALLALGRLYLAQATAPERSILLLALTAEESGLLGSRWYAENPLYPLATTVANLNMDNIYKGMDGLSSEVAVVGFGNSELDNYLAEVAAGQDRVLVQEPNPEKGFYYRSDHFNFAKVGVPALYTTRSNASREHGRVWGQNQLDAFTANDYHKPSDEYSPDWDLSGAAENVLLMYGIGSRLAASRDFPEWAEGNEFKDIRDASEDQRVP